MRRLRFTRPARLAAELALIGVGLALTFFIVKLSLRTPSKRTEQHLTIAADLSVIIAAITGIAALVLAFRQRQNPGAKRLDLLSPNLRRDDRLVDRAADLTDLVEHIRDSSVVNCHGQRGAGKSFLLEHLADVVNRHRRADASHPRPSKIKAALYFDLADAGGFEQIQAQLCQSAFGERDGSWSEFVAHVENSFAKRQVLLILDNMNAPGVWQSLGKAAYQYLAKRPNDKVVFGSIDPVVLNNLRVSHLPLSGLDLVATSELVANRGVEMSETEVAELHEDFSGLPFYVCLLTADGGRLPTGRGVDGIESVIDSYLVSEIMPEAQRLLAYASLFALVTRQIPVVELARCPLTQLERQIDVVDPLLTRVPHDGRKLVKMHDLVRDAALRALRADVSEAALFLFERAREREQIVDAAIYAMFADPHRIGRERFDEVLYPLIRTAVRSRNYALLSNLHARATQNARILEFLSADRDREDLFCYARASELAGLGHYAEAQESLLASSITRTRPDRSETRSELQTDLQFLAADLAHLRNRYDEAALMFQELGEWAASTEDASLHARCKWGHGHVLRHQGRNLDLSLMLFAEALTLGDGSNELFAKAYSITGATAIKVYRGEVPSDEEARLSCLEAEIASTSAHDGYMLEVWKSQAQVAWLRGNEDAALQIIENAIGRALTLNDRLLYNLYFERAEYCRFKGSFALAIEDYGLALQFGEGNGDRNLISNALLGLVSVDISAKDWLHHRSEGDARASALQARELARHADIQVTSRTAATIAAMLDDEQAESVPPRLILF